MSDHLSQLPEDSKKLLEKPLMGGIAVPIAIVLVGAVIIFGISKMLSNNRNYRDLVSELHSKTFGNRWVAAYELSKLISAKQIPKEDHDWLIENLSMTYKESIDARTRNFIILAMGTMPTQKSHEVLNLALNDQDEKVKFNAVVAIGNSSQLLSEINWDKIIEMLDGNDAGLKQVAVFSLAQHKIEKAIGKIQEMTKDQDRSLKYAASFALIKLSSFINTPILEEILKLSENSDPIFNAAQIEALKMNTINAIGSKVQNTDVKKLLDIALQDSNPRVSMKAREFLNLLKK